MDSQVEFRLRESVAVGDQADIQYGAVQPRLAKLRDAIHSEWENTPPGEPEKDAELKYLLRAVSMLETLFKREIDGGKVASHNLAKLDQSRDGKND